jgi:23S rRNA (uracil1939-C5)-methyltransferase
MARPKRGERLSLTIDDLAFGGEGVGRADGYVVFVPGGVPGDRVRVRLDQARSRFGRGLIEEIEAPSPHRVEAPCPYFGRCGGCRLQHVSYSAQLAFKAKQVADVLERVGGLQGLEIRPILGAEEIYGYRNKMEFTIAPRAAGGVDIGLHVADRYDSVLDMERCLIQSEGMNALLDEARRFFLERGFSAYEQETGEGLLRFLMLRDGRRTGEAMVNVVTSAPAVSELAPLVERVQARLPGTSSVVMNVNPKKASVAVGVEEHLLGGREHQIEEPLGLHGIGLKEGVGGDLKREPADALANVVAPAQQVLLDPHRHARLLGVHVHHDAARAGQPGLHPLDERRQLRHGGR